MIDLVDATDFYLLLFEDDLDAVDWKVIRVVWLLGLMMTIYGATKLATHQN